MNTDTNLPNATVSWTPPNASDNSGEAVTLTSDYSPGDAFPIGTTTVTYTATDAYGNTGTYTFNVVVTGITDSVQQRSRIYHINAITMNFYGNTDSHTCLRGSDRQFMTADIRIKHVYDFGVACYIKI